MLFVTVKAGILEFVYFSQVVNVRFGIAKRIVATETLQVKCEGDCVLLKVVTLTHPLNLNLI